MATVGFGPGFFIPGPDPRAKTRGPNPARSLSGFFFGAQTRPLWSLWAPLRDWAQLVAQPKKKKKEKRRRIEAQIYFCHIQPVYSNSSLDNVAQMPSPTKKEKRKKKFEAQIHIPPTTTTFLDSLSSQKKSTSSYIFSYTNFLCSSLIRENFKNGVQAFGYHTEFGQGLEGLEYFLQDGPVRRRFNPRWLLQQ